jgi:exopolyphosphatase/guanosine-5'-triphosphate,3'-diphosphate pyrophosphatase
VRYASIDIGTNAVLLLIVDTEHGLRDVLDFSTITRLGEGLKETGDLSGNAMARTFVCLRRYIDAVRTHGADALWCVGTSALREAGNSDAFRQKVKDELGIQVRVISPRQEAYYTYLSVREDEKIGDPSFIIVDIGGGSTEIIEGSKDAFADYISLPAGTVKLTEMCINHDPPTEKELSHVTAHARELLETPFSLKKGAAVVGTGGTITTLGSIILGLENFDKTKIHGMKVSLNDLSAVIGRLTNMTTAERATIKGMESGREDIILQGIILMREIMFFLGARTFTVSTKGVRYGVIFEALALKA